MAKNNKDAAKAAMNKNGNAPETKEEAKVLTQVMDAAKSNHLSQDSKVMLAYLTQKRWVENPNLPAALIEGANVITDALMADTIVTSLAKGDETFTMLICRDENKYLAISAALNTMGITLPSFKELPAPSEEQLKKLGVKLLPGQKAEDTTVVTIDKNNVDKTVMEKKKKEVAIEKKNPTTDPTKIENEDQLKESLQALLMNMKETPDTRIQNAVAFYQSYLEIQAQKAENKDAEIERIKGLSRPVLLKQISELLGNCTYALEGLGKFFTKSILESNSPVVPFKMYKTASKGTSDEIAAEMVKTLVVWTNESRMKNCQEYIDIASSDKSKKDDEKRKANINAAKESIEECKNVIAVVTNPSFDAVNNLIENYNSSDTQSNEYRIAHRIVSNVKDLYYKKIDVAKVGMSAFLHNCQQYAGIITNLFCDPLSKSKNYDITNIVELKETEAAEDEGKKQEEKSEESKN